MENELKLTSVKLLKDVHNKFKKETLDKNFSLQKLVNRSLYLYITDINFKNGIDNFIELQNKNKNL